MQMRLTLLQTEVTRWVIMVTATMAVKSKPANPAE